MILRSKLHFLNKKLQLTSVEVCSETLWPGSTKMEIKLGMIKRVKLLELKRVIDEILVACKNDEDF
jgi:hypothetical protein